MSKRSLHELLVHKFMTEYGYSNGPVIAQAIVTDILGIFKRCYPENVPPKTVLWMAVRREWKGRRKGIKLAALVPIRLSVVTEDELELLAKPELRKKLKARRAFNRARFARWCFEAYDQGGVLTLLDLSMLSGMSEHYAGELLREYETETGKIVPTRGTVHDIGGSVTHKAEVVRRWLRKESPAQIARATDHSQRAVDRYISDFQKVRLLAQRFSEADLPMLAGLPGNVVKQYLALLREYEPTLVLYSSDTSSSGDISVPAPAETPARSAGRVKGDRRESAAPLDSGEHLATVEQVLEQAAC
jgi:hypothetical protein